MGKVRDKNTSNKLKVSPDLFQRAVDNAFDHMIITDVDGTIIYANKAVEKITGYSLKEIIGAKPSLWGREMSVEFYQDLWRIIKVQKKSFVGEITNCRKSGERYIAELHIAPVLDDEGKVIMFIGIERDITKQKRIDQMKTDFVSFVSHELRTPLTVISFSTEMLLSDNVNSFDHKQAQLLQEIYRRDQQMIELIESLLDVNKFELDNWSVTKKKTNIHRLLNEMIKNQSIITKQKKIKITNKFGPEKSVSSDPKLLKLLFGNLISNAVKYVDVNGKIEIITEIKKDRFCFTISDNGYGIPLGQQKDIFTRSFRADNARKLEITGNGLGLYLCKIIVDRLGGKIWFKSKQNKGTTFFVSLSIK